MEGIPQPAQESEKKWDPIESYYKNLESTLQNEENARLAVIRAEEAAKDPSNIVDVEGAKMVYESIKSSRESVQAYIKRLELLGT